MKKSKKAKAFLLSGLVVLVAGVAVLPRLGEGPSEAGGSQLDGLVAAPVASQVPPKSALGQFQEGMNSWVTDDYMQTVYVEDFDSVEIIDRHYESASDSWSQKAYYGSTTFTIQAVASNGKDRIYLAGIDNEGLAVVQEWRLRPGPSIPGQEPTKRIRRKELYRGVLELPFYALAVDPESRFMLALAGGPSDKVLYTMPVQAHSTPSVLFDTQSLPGLSGMRHVQRLQHSILGRVWEFDSEEPGASMILLVDGNNDGVFDSPIHGTYDDLRDQGIYGPGLWTDSFSGGW